MVPAPLTICPGCGLQLPSRRLEPDSKANASGECRELMNEMSYYTLAHGDPRFVHQHLVDAYGAQHVRLDRSTIGAAFTLAGLYLAVERGFTGRQVQKTHMLMAKQSKQWPRFIPPNDPGHLTVADVLAVPPGPRRDDVLLDWCKSVWAAWSEQQQRVRDMVDRFL